MSGDTVEHGGLPKGTFTVGGNVTRSGNYSLKHGLDGAVLFMGLPRLHGWRPFGAMILAHQTYKKDVVTWLRENPGAREVAVLAVDTGEWATVWTKHGHEPSASQRGGGE